MGEVGATPIGSQVCVALRGGVPSPLTPELHMKVRRDGQRGRRPGSSWTRV